MRSEPQNKMRSAIGAAHVVLWLCAGTSCLVDNPAYQRATIETDASASPDARWQQASDVTMSLPPQVPTKGLIGWWSFDQIEGGVVRDLSGNGLDGTVVGKLSLIAGRQGQAASFNGNTYVNVRYKPVLNEISGAVTVAAWVWSKTTSPRDRQMLLSRQERDGVWEHYGLACVDDTVVMYLAPNLSDHVHEPRLPSEWVHTAATFDGSTLRLYINGVEQEATEQSPRWGSDTNGLSIGANQNQDLIEEFFEGFLDSLGLWKRALSVDEIKRLAAP